MSTRGQLLDCPAECDVVGTLRAHFMEVRSALRSHE